MFCKLMTQNGYKRHKTRHRKSQILTLNWFVGIEMVVIMSPRPHVNNFQLREKGYAWKQGYMNLLTLDNYV